jgi:hypothetical protein
MTYIVHSKVPRNKICTTFGVLGLKSLVIQLYNTNKSKDTHDLDVTEGGPA